MQNFVISVPFIAVGQSLLVSDQAMSIRIPLVCNWSHRVTVRRACCYLRCNAVGSPCSINILSLPWFKRSFAGLSPRRFRLDTRWTKWQWGGFCFEYCVFPSQFRFSTQY